MPIHHPSRKVWKYYIPLHLPSKTQCTSVYVQLVWNLMTNSDAREGKWKGNWRMEWAASTLHTTSEHGVSSITNADAHNSAPSSRLNWRPRRFKWTRPFRWKTKSGSCTCAIRFQTRFYHLFWHSYELWFLSTRCIYSLLIISTSNSEFIPKEHKLVVLLSKKKCVYCEVWNGIVYIFLLGQPMWEVLLPVLRISPISVNPPVLHVHLHICQGQADEDRKPSNKFTLSRISGRTEHKITFTFLVLATSILILFIRLWLVN